MAYSNRLILAGALMLLTGCAQFPTDLLTRPQLEERLSCSQMHKKGADTRAAVTVDPTGCSFLAEGKESFRRGDYGLAERNFRKAVEAFSGSANGVRENYLEALLGLAASYDAMKRFDLADQIYTTLGQIAPDSPEFNNNYGYSLLLRGDRVRAKPYLEKARALSPNNGVIQTNSGLL